MPIRLSRSVKYIVIACIAAFIIQMTVDMYLGGHLLYILGLVPSEVVIHYRFWQLFTYAFLHGDVMHLFFNLMMLAFIGSEIEMSWGAPRFLRYFFFCSVSAGLAYLILTLLRGSLDVPMVGASGAIYGLLLAYGILFGERVLLFMMLFPMKAKHFVWILGGLELMTTVFSPGGGLASVAHLAGMVAGLVYLYARATWSLAKKRKAQGLSPFTGAKPVKKRRANPHLKLVIDNKKAGPTGPDDHEDPDDDLDTPKTWN